MTTFVTPSPTLSPSSAFYGSPRSFTSTLRRSISPQTAFAASSHRSANQSPAGSLCVSPSISRRLNVTSPANLSIELQSIRQAAVKPRGNQVDAGTQYSPPGFPPTSRWPRAPAAPLTPAGSTSDLTEHQPKSATKRRESDAVKQSLNRQDPERPQQLPSPSPSAVGSEPASASTSSTSPSKKRARPNAPMAKVLPKSYAECDVTDLGVLIADMLMDLVEINDKIPLKDGSLTRFHSRAPPGISIKDYLNRLIVHATLSQAILLSMVYYMDRLCALYPGFTVSSLTVHRFLIAAATVAAKGLSDSFWTNSTYARVGGVSVKELALLELDFLEKMGWRIVPQPEVLGDYYKSLVERNGKYTFGDN